VIGGRGWREGFKSELGGETNVAAGAGRSCWPRGDSVETLSHMMPCNETLCDNQNMAGSAQFGR
jgi:hypothetical protein